MVKKLFLKEVYRKDLFESLSNSGVFFEVFNENDNVTGLEMDDDSVAGLIKNGKLVAGMSLTKEENYWVVEYVWANDPPSAYMLFLTSLKYYGALTPSESLTPASQSIIKRWYKKHANDDSIKPINKYELVEDWHNAIYTLPKGMDSKVPIKSPEDPEKLIDGVRDEFNVAYLDSDRTGKEGLDEILEKEGFGKLSLKIITMLNKGGQLAEKTKKWVYDNFYKIRDTAMKEFKSNHSIDYWNKYIAQKYDLPQI